MTKVSVIVPVYNVEQYLEKCLNSLVNQDFSDYEIIIVNDGSLDNSEKIINKYKKQYKFVKAYKKKNGGLSSARNYGLKYAKGEYISFIDSDDWVESNMLKEMYEKAISQNFDIVVSDIKYIYKDHDMIVTSKVDKDLLTKEDIRKNMIDFFPTACNKIFKKELFDKVKFKVGFLYEDVEFMYRLFPHLNSIGVIKESYYNYLQRENAITSTFDSRVLHYIDNWNGLIEYYKNEGFYNYYKKELEYCYVRYIYGTMVKNMLNFTDFNEVQNGVDLAIKNVKDNFKNYRLNKYFYKSIKGLYLVLFNRRLIKYMYKKRRAN